MLSVDLVCLLSPLLLPFLHATAGSPVSVFRPTGGSVTLEFQGHQQLEKKSLDYIMWWFGQAKIMKYIPLRDTVTIFTHKDRVEFDKETFSLELKNLQKNDSGLYRGEIGGGETEVKAEYMLSVLDPVESPVLSVVSNWSSCDSCNVTVTCWGRDLSLTSTCDCNTCSPEEEHSTNSNVILSVREQKVTPPGNWIWFILVVVPVCAGIALLIWSIRRRLTAGVGQPQTEYAEVMMSSAPGPPDTAGSPYSTVGPHQPPPPEENPYAEIPEEAQDEDRTLNLPRDPGSSGGVPQIPEEAQDEDRTLNLPRDSCSSGGVPQNGQSSHLPSQDGCFPKAEQLQREL